MKWKFSIIKYLYGHYALAMTTCVCVNTNRIQNITQEILWCDWMDK